MVGKGAIAIAIATGPVVLEGWLVSSLTQWSVEASIPVSTHADNTHI